MPKETDTLIHDLKNYARMEKSSMMKESRKKKKQLLTASFQFTFGINLKKDNQHKTKQLNLF